MLREYKDLRVVLMSATIDTKMFIEFFGGCPVIEMEGRTFPVKRKRANAVHLAIVFHCILLATSSISNNSADFFLEDVVTMLKYMPPPPEKKRKEDADVEVDEKVGCRV